MRSGADGRDLTWRSVLRFQHSSKRKPQYVIIRLGEKWKKTRQRAKTFELKTLKKKTSSSSCLTWNGSWLLQYFTGASPFRRLALPVRIEGRRIIFSVTFKEKGYTPHFKKIKWIKCNKERKGRLIFQSATKFTIIKEKKFFFELPQNKSHVVI